MSFVQTFLKQFINLSKTFCIQTFLKQLRNVCYKNVHTVNLYKTFFQCFLYNRFKDIFHLNVLKTFLKTF
jgi:hypothetical protein